MGANIEESTATVHLMRSMIESCLLIGKYTPEGRSYTSSRIEGLTVHGQVFLDALRSTKERETESLNFFMRDESQGVFERSL